ncbi:MAG: ABC-F family ATP-binding cassette domain-containing protein [Clostridia bacterium]|nr:ABC-F family ATP-binding cassette domain-containing protein [Clostridia bacterium]
MTIISLSGLFFSVGDKNILENVGFSVQEGDKVGIVGANGAGKTTLFRLLSGEYTPTDGSVFVAKERTFGLLRQDETVKAESQSQTVLNYMVSSFPELLALEGDIADTELALAECQAQNNEKEVLSLSGRLAALHEVYGKKGGLEFRSRCRGMLLHLGFSEEDLSRPVSSLSGGQHTRLALSLLLSKEPDILLLDELTNHLDMDALFWLEDFLRGYTKTVLVISHDRYFLDRTTNKTLMLQYGHAKLYHGNYSAAKKEEALDIASQEKNYKEQQKIIVKIEANIGFQRRCGQEHNFVTIRAKQKQLDRMERVEKVRAPEKNIHFAFQSEASYSQEVLRVKDLSFGYQNAPLLSHLSFLVKKDSRIAILGANGCGKSTLIKLLAGKLLPQEGSIYMADSIKLGYYDQEVRSLDESKTVFEELHDAYPQKTNGEIRSALALFLFGAEDVDKQISVLSGGERARLTLAKLMLCPVNLLLLDEPTNHLDIGSREALEVALSAFEGTVITVSHDRYFVDRVADTLLELSPEAENGCAIYTPYENESAFACYLRHHAAKVEPKVEKKETKSESKEDYLRQKEKAAKERAERARKEKAEKEISLLEKRIEALKQELFGEAASDYVKAAALQEEIDKAEERLLELYEIIMT